MLEIINKKIVAILPNFCANSVYIGFVLLVCCMFCLYLVLVLVKILYLLLFNTQNMQVAHQTQQLLINVLILYIKTYKSEHLILDIAQVFTEFTLIEFELSFSN